jgi:hypothetical protein
MAGKNYTSFAKQKKGYTIFALRKIIIQTKLSKKFDKLEKYIYYIEISLNTSFFKELIPKQQRKNMFIENINCSEKFATKDK